MAKKIDIDLPGRDSGNKDLNISNSDFAIQIRDLSKKYEELHQIIHNKGLETGVPKRILSNINRVLENLKKFENIFDYETIEKMEKEFDEEITKIVNRGEEIIAVKKCQEKLSDMYRLLNKLGTWIDKVISNLEDIERDIVSISRRFDNDVSKADS